MSFFDKTETVGWMIVIIGILSIIRALANLAAGINDDNTNGETIGAIIIAVGYIIGAVILFLFGNKVRVGTVSSKLDILAGYVQTMGLMTVVSSFFLMVGGAVMGTDDGKAIAAGGIVILIFGAIILYIGKSINNGERKLGVLWIILVILFFLCMVGSLLSIGGSIVNIIEAVCGFIMYLFILVFLFDREVKDAMT